MCLSFCTSWLTQVWVLQLLLKIRLGTPLTHPAVISQALPREWKTPLMQESSPHAPWDLGCTSASGTGPSPTASYEYFSNAYRSVMQVKEGWAESHSPPSSPTHCPTGLAAGYPRSLFHGSRHMSYSICGVPGAGGSWDLGPQYCGVHGGWLDNSCFRSLCLMDWRLESSGPSAHSDVQRLYHKENWFGTPCSVLYLLIGQDKSIFLCLKVIFLNRITLTSIEGYYRLFGYIYSVLCSSSGFKNQITLSF